MDHSHCRSCYSVYCLKQECPVVYCPAGCYAKLHQCKTEDHALVCPYEIVSCINASSGCTFRFPRCQMARHMQSCPAYVVICCFQWVRKMLQNAAPYHAHFVKKPRNCSNQLDLALTFYDQKRGHKKLVQYVGKHGVRACQDVEIGKSNFNHSYSYNPCHATPGALRWYRTATAQKVPSRRPPFMTPVPSFLQNCAAYKPPPPLHWTTFRPMCLIANKLPNKDKVHITEKKVARHDDSFCNFGATHDDTDICTRVESNFSCYNIIAINNLPLLHRSEASLHMSCGQMLRRDQISAHTDAVHNRIMAGVMDGWMIKRCPLAGYGCPFYQIRIQPKGGKHQVKFDEKLGVFYLHAREPLPPPSNTPELPAEIWCLIGQYCDTYTLSQLCSVSHLHNMISLQLLHSRGLAHKRWTRGLGPRLWAKRRQADWGMTASLTEVTEWELADIPHISCHLSKCAYNVRTEHKPALAQVYGHPIIDPSVILRNF